jgi:hypothetical protein
MGQHTWFYKNKEERKKELELWEKLDKHDTGEDWLDYLEIDQINNQINLIRKANDSEYHDLFRTNKRNPDRTYTDDSIESEEDCYKWLKDNKEFVYSYNKEDEKILKEFWTKYPNGAIDFG